MSNDSTGPFEAVQAFGRLPAWTVKGPGIIGSYGRWRSESEAWECAVLLNDIYALGADGKQDAMRAVKALLRELKGLRPGLDRAHDHHGVQREKVDAAIRLGELALGVPGPDLGEPEAHCERCGGRNAKCWHSPSPFWNAVMRDQDTGIDIHDIVCPTCFVELAEAKGIVANWCLRPHDIPYPKDPKGRAWNDVDCLWMGPLGVPGAELLVNSSAVENDKAPEDAASPRCISGPHAGSAEQIRQQYEGGIQEGDTVMEAKPIDAPEHFMAVADGHRIRIPVRDNNMLGEVILCDHITELPVARKMLERLQAAIRTVEKGIPAPPPPPPGRIIHEGKVPPQP